MGKKYDQISEKHIDFIIRQQIFFVATGASEGRINLSPKGLDSLRIVNPNQVVWLNLTGSGNETATHLMEDGRITLMFCAFEGDPKILRLYGRASSHLEGSEAWDAHIGRFPLLPGGRQIILMDVEMVASACGYGVPLFSYQGERDALIEWAEKKGEKGVREFQEKYNKVSVDGKPTDLAEEF
ncbi:MAG: pyridoxamine 5'-phosphate oxidase [gamma proteobacterium symbiont of Ctena orbiculata]|uniref:Pyridoxamine 5'-phosphate oxidase family protein n=1 Tax=Candidatus Thiodiazotropha taylori TaxID=2792791 RepID=A0A944MCA3_9GAMM|nr:pyridoxamine 5'-phosphate oxidase family protein [Candidatus Thiodiazotropha taylori]PUB87259.1 MAG: pyridoxamine 5'-phosphate oxidase family protein [gamma proteobacterium symbiont of Ctena orbiculata]MBT2989273.1 pyridoxamine 5'-phosphate oxidase family protein [Candidatus Thiodiazotropha taylori]MBT2995518.1 pyridoxamine 5'-phosphate oxidase family protein [Candidatus Thiodiazotropha taylori]MBT2999528.1 pyridoxamine 5'-phosphate oxidase family protein [Candidatus Thiodiazotropha taylori]